MKAEEEIFCDRCGKQIAFYNCLECKVPFCFQCGKDIHKKGKWLKHYLQKINNNNNDNNDNKGNIKIS